MTDPAPDELTAPGGPFEMVEEDVFGEPMLVFRNRARSTRELLAGSGEYGADAYVVCGDRRLTFADHLADVAALSSVLADEYGVRPGDRVALLAANCPEWITAFWATTGMGAVAASMNAWWAPPEAEFALRSAEPAVVIADLSPSAGATANPIFNLHSSVLPQNRRYESV